jgi:hypothetical protein
MLQYRYYTYPHGEREVRAVDTIDVFGTWGTEPNSKILPPELRCTLIVLRRLYTVQNYAAHF